MSVEFSLDYEGAMEAANTLGQTAAQYRQMSSVLANAGQQLATQSFVGLAGQAMLVYLQQVQAHLARMASKADEMQADLMETIRSFRDDIDPGTAQRFQD